MGACICCYSEGAKVAQVLNAFPSLRASQAQEGVLQKVVGRVVLAGQQPFYAPVSGKPCVYFKTTVREERLVQHSWRDRDGHRHTELRPEWFTIATEVRFTNFYLQDGHSKVFVPGDRGTCRIQSGGSSGQSGAWSGPPPPGVQTMIAQYFQARGQVFWGWGAMAGMRTGRYDFFEEAFDVNEIVAALGVPIAAKDPYTNAPCKVIQPFGQDTLTEEWMKENDWSLLQRKSWETLLKDGGAVMLSDNADQTAGIPVAVIQDLPQYMLHTATRAEQFTAMYTAAPPTEQPVATAFAATTVQPVATAKVTPM